MAEENPGTSNVNVASMKNSIVQQNSPGAKASIRVIAGEEKSQVETLLKSISELIGSLSFKDDDREEIEGEVTMTETELKGKKPKAGIVTTCLRSIASKLTTAMASPLAVEVAGQTQRVIEMIHSYLGAS